MLIMADVRVSEIMERLDLADAPQGYSASDTVEMEVTIDESEVHDDRPEPEPETLADLLDETNVRDLAAAIRRGDTAEAELLLDRLMSADDKVSSWVQMGRYSRKARVDLRLRKAA